MSESFSVSSTLTLGTNVDAVIRRLIDQFERLDTRVKGSQSNLAAFERNLAGMGKEGSGLKNAFAELKLPQGLLSQVEAVVGFTSQIASHSMQAAGAWKEMAAAARSVRNTPMPGSAGASGATGGPRRGNPMAEDRVNAIWMSPDFDPKATFQSKLLADEQKAILREIAAREKATETRIREEQKLLSDEQRAVQREIAERERATENRARMEQRLLDEEQRAVQKQIAERERAEAQHFRNTYMQVKQNNAAWDRKNEHIGQTAGAAGVGLQAISSTPLNFLEKAAMTSFDFEHRFATVTADTRVTPDQEKDLRQTIKEVQTSVPGSTPSEILEIFTDLKNTFGDFGEAKEELKSFTSMVTTLQMADLRRGGEGDMHQALSTARFVEDQGGAIDPANPGKYDATKFDEIAKKAVSIYVATQGRVAPDDMLKYQKMARTGGMMMNDHALYGEVPFFAQGFGASKLGTAIFSDVQVMLANRMTEKTADALGAMGLFAGKHLVPAKGHEKAHMEWDQGTLKGKNLLASDPFSWIHDILGAQIAKTLGVDTNSKEGQEKVLLKLTELAQRGTVAGLWGDVYRNYGPAQKESANITAQNPEMMAHYLKQDPLAQLQVFRAAEENLMLAIGELVKGPALQGLQNLTDSLNHFAKFLDDNPKMGEKITTIAAEFALASTVLGSVATFAIVGGPVFSMTKWLGGLGLGIARFGVELTPFAEGGMARAALGGLTAGLGPLALALGTAYLALRPTPVASQKTEDLLIGKSGLDPHRFDAFGRPAATDHGSGIAGYFGRLFDSKSYYHDPILTPEANSTRQQTESANVGQSAGSRDNPLHVVVTGGEVAVSNQISEAGIARGVETSIGRRGNRPPSGYSGSDPRIDPFGSFAGMVTP